MNRDDRLRTMLTEDLDDQEAFDATFDVLKRLQKWDAPQTTPIDTTALITTLTGELEANTRRSRLHHYWNAWPVLLMRAQLRVVQREIWAASLIVLLLGLAVTIATFEPTRSVTHLPFVLLAPLVTAITISYVYGPASEPALEIELAAPTSQRLILLARLTLVFSFNLMIGLIGSGILSLSGVNGSLGTLIGIWLAPMAFLSALAFLLGAVFHDPAISTIISLGIWTVQVLRQYIDVNANPVMTHIPDLLAVENRPLLLLFGLALVLLGLWWVGREEHWLHTTRV